MVWEASLLFLFSPKLCLVCSSFLFCSILRLRRIGSQVFVAQRSLLVAARIPAVRVPVRAQAVGARLVARPNPVVRVAKAPAGAAAMMAQAAVAMVARAVEAGAAIIKARATTKDDGGGGGCKLYAVLPSRFSFFMISFI